MVKQLTSFPIKLQLLRSVPPLTFASLLFSPASFILHLGVEDAIKH